MTLAEREWQELSIHDVVSEFLLSERGKYAWLGPALMAKIDSPVTSNSSDNHLRLRLLYWRRLHLMAEIPPDTKWYEVRRLTDAELSELRVIGRCGWDSPHDQNELEKVATRLQESLFEEPIAWHKPILWGHDRLGPFTILEGNHRLTAYCGSNKPKTLSVPVLVGLSPTPCFWHLPDQPHFLANDLIKREVPPFIY